MHFSFNDKSNDSLIIDLSSNLLSSESFDRYSFDVNGRTATVKLSYNTSINVMKETYFKSFVMKAKQNNTIEMTGNELNCVHNNVWISGKQSKIRA